jgi:cell pole-organizing protein PopZ
MSGPNPTPTSGSDPSMEDILSSIRRILSEDEAPPPAGAVGQAAGTEDVLELDSAMMVPEPASSGPDAPVAAAGSPDTAAVAAGSPDTAAVAASAVQQMLRRLGSQPGVRVAQAGPSIEELVREELRPLLQAWLDRHLEPLLQRAVRAEIDRLLARVR